MRFVGLNEASAIVGHKDVKEQQYKMSPTHNMSSFAVL